MRSRPKTGLTPRCSRIKRNGEQCKLPSVTGATVCYSHGGALPVVKAAAARRVQLAEALAALPRRHPAHVLLDATHVADVLQQLAVQNIQAGDTVDETTVTKLQEAISLAQKMASAVFTAKANDVLAEKAQLEGASIARVLNRALSLSQLDDDTEYRLRQNLRVALIEEDEREREHRPAIEASSPPTTSYKWT